MFINQTYQVISVGPITIEECEGVNPYPVRKITVEEYDNWKHNRFYGTIGCNDALLNLKKGDLIQADASFGVYKKRGKWNQWVLFNHLIKLNEEIQYD